VTNPIDKLAALARREHGYEENGWVCNDKLWPERKWQCGCGADDHNAQVDAVLAGLGEVRIRSKRGTGWGYGHHRHRELVIELLEPVSDTDELPKTENAP